VCGSPTELLVVLGVLIAMILIQAALRTRARSRSTRSKDDAGIRVRFLPDDEDRSNDE
jgi:hypothetical protein